PAKAAAAKKPKKAASGSKARKPAGPSVTELITKAVSASKERKGLSLAALKKALAAGGYDVEKNNSRIKLGLKSLVSKGTKAVTAKKSPRKVKPAAKKAAKSAKVTKAVRPKKAVAAARSPAKVNAVKPEANKAAPKK
ncbi:H15 protein, partial [Peucedramus taeniatus]|nr:H15 protein [Peucedramus taeniatus]